MIIARLETRHFTFEAAGHNRNAALDALTRGWAEHCAQNEHADPCYLTDNLGDITWLELEPGQCRRDGDLLELRVGDDLRQRVKLEVFRAISAALSAGVATTGPRQRIAEDAGTMTARISVTQPVTGEVRIEVRGPRGKRYFQVTTLETDEKGVAL